MLVHEVGNDARLEVQDVLAHSINMIILHSYSTTHVTSPSRHQGLPMKD